MIEGIDSCGIPEYLDDFVKDKFLDKVEADQRLRVCDLCAGVLNKFKKLHIRIPLKTTNNFLLFNYLPAPFAWTVQTVEYAHLFVLIRNAAPDVFVFTCKLTRKSAAFST